MQVAMTRRFETQLGSDNNYNSNNNSSNNNINYNNTNYSYRQKNISNTTLAPISGGASSNSSVAASGNRHKRYYAVFLVAASVYALFALSVPFYYNLHDDGMALALRAERNRGMAGALDAFAVGASKQARGRAGAAPGAAAAAASNSKPKPGSTRTGKNRAGAAATRAVSDAGTAHGAPKPGPRSNRSNAAMVLAVAPLDKRHVTALWTELDCFTRDESLTEVLVSAPTWSRDMVLRLLDEVRKKLPQFSGSTPRVKLSASFFENDRYDVGLWCDGLEELLHRKEKENNNNNNNNNDPIDHFVLLNDSLFALRPFTGILDALGGKTDDPTIPYSSRINPVKSSSSSSSSLSRSETRMVSLSYSLTDPAGMWLESVFRAFDRTGLEAFRNHSCHPVTHPSFCSHVTDSRTKKKCIVNNHEVAIARLFAPGAVVGLYPSDVPRDMWREDRPYGTWASHKEFWESVLVKQHNFPAAKVSKRNMIKTMKNPYIQECTARFDRSIFETEKEIFDFSKGVRTIERDG